MDKIDKKIITLLQQNARMPLKALAENVFLSSPAVSARIERLEKEEIMENNNQEYNTVTLMLDDNTECECAIIRIFPAGDNDYIALLPLEGEAADNDEVYLYRYKVEGDNEPVLENIESDEEYELVSEAFDEELDAMEYEDLYEEEDNEQ